MTDLNITDAIFDWAEQRPHAVAVIDGETVVSYRTLCHGVRLAAQRFRQAGWRAGDIVGISLSGSPVLHILVSIALARSGITQVSLSMAESVPLARERMRKVGATGVVTDHAVENPGMTTVAPELRWLGDAPESSAVEDVRAGGGDRIWIISESSGTTGAPKLIGISHAIEEAHGRRAASVFGYRRDERFLTLTGFRFLTGLKRAIRCLCEGGTVTVPPVDLNYAQLLDWIDVHDVTYLSGVPLHLHNLLSVAHTDRPRLPALRILRCSSGALPPAMLAEVRRRISPNIYTTYGASEAGPMAAATPEMLAVHPDTVGRPLDGIEVDIVDDADRPLPSGAVGRVRARGLGLVPTYVGMVVGDQSRVFRDGWCYTGDVGWMSEDGLLFLKGRADDTMNFDGIMVGPAEIESVLRQHPAVADVAAFALPSPEHQDVPAAAIVSAQPLQIDELANFCRERLGVRAPRLFLRVDAIPRNPMGKVLRRELTKLALAMLQKQARR